MASLRDIRRRIASVQNTRKITKAMEMVAAAKLRRNQARIEALRPYAGDMIEMMIDLATYSEDARQYALLQEREVKTVAVVAMTGDRGLAGAFNANVVRKAMAIEQRPARARRGDARPGRRTQGHRHAQVPWLPAREELAGPQRPAAVHRRQGDRRRAHRDVPERAGRPRAARLQPLHVAHRADAHGRRDPARAQGSRHRRRATSAAGRYIYEPAPEDILEGLLPAYVEIAVYRALLESSASEQGARMSAMRNASDSAEEMIDGLTLALNRARQAAITQEILEVVAGAEALG